MTTLDLSALPPNRAARVLDVFRRETAAEMIRDVYPHQNVRFREAEAFHRTAAIVSERVGVKISARWVQRVMREGR